MPVCQLCRVASPEALLTAGPQPVSCRFSSSREENPISHPMTLGQCPKCGLVQLLGPIPIDALSSRPDWIALNEPDGHLDQLCSVIAELPDLGRSASILGLSVNDAPVLDRLTRLGYRRARLLDPRVDLGITGRSDWVDQIQDRFTPASASALASRYGPADVVVARYVLEHAQSLSAFLDALHELLAPGGYAVFEVPDCSRPMGASDFSALWEEHVHYFTPEVFSSLPSFSRLAPVYEARHAYPLEDALVTIARRVDQAVPRLPSDEAVRGSLAQGRRFADSFGPTQRRTRARLERTRRDGGKVALLGAGHRAASFLNLLGLKDCVDLVLDDDHRKWGLYLAGNLGPIVPSDALLSGEVRLCLLAVSPNIEAVVLERCRGFLDRGGAFLSIYPGSRYAAKGDA